MVIPQNSGDRAMDMYLTYFMPYAKVKVGSYLVYNKAMDKMIVVASYENPQFRVVDISKELFKKNKVVMIEKL